MFNAVFSHLDDDKRAEIRDLMEHERKELRTARGREQILVSIRYTGKGLDFGFREGEPI